MQLNGLHHISAITGDARRNLAFYTGVLGLRLIAKTVNQDDPTVYHLFYGDEHAQPGLELTFFEYPGAIPGRAGAGMVHRIVWRVGSADALAFWADRLEAHDVPHRTSDDGSVLLTDPEGLDHELAVSDAPDAPLVADHPEIPAEHALQGFAGVRAYSAHPERSQPWLEGLLGAARGDAAATWTLRGHDRGGWIAYDPPPDEPGRQSGGCVHHVAWGTRDAEHEAWLARLEQAGVASSGLVDRHYFRSIYVREPSGVLFELASDAPGFLVDGLAEEELGTRIILPPWLESRRAATEARLTPLPDPRADWPARAG